MFAQNDEEVDVKASANVHANGTETVVLAGDDGDAEVVGSGEP